MEEIPVIAIDGLSGSGKGTISKMLCLELGWNILDSGALYRTLAYFMLENGIALKDFNEKKDYIDKNFLVKFDPGIIGEPVKVIFNNKDITSKVRTEEIAKKTSYLATEPIIREFIKPCQRDFMKPPGLVADGRDMGTVIFKNARHKVFLTASVEERVKRREAQLKRQGSKVNMRFLLSELEARDKKDIERELSPLKPAKGAIVINTTKLSPEEVLGEIKSFL